MRLIEVKPNEKKIIEKIYQNEIESFGVMGGADMWMIMSFIRYGKLYVLIDESDEILSVTQYQGILGKNEVFLYGFSTPLKNRGMGYGKTLLKKTHEKLKLEKIKKIYLTVDPKNEIAIRMYRNMGYEILELQQNEYGENIDRYLMVKKLL